MATSSTTTPRISQLADRLLEDINSRELMPGDRLFISEDPLVKFDSVVQKYTRPFERLFGFVSLGTAMANRITRYGLGQF